MSKILENLKQLIRMGGSSKSNAFVDMPLLMCKAYAIGCLIFGVSFCTVCFYVSALCDVGWNWNIFWTGLKAVACGCVIYIIGNIYCFFSPKESMLKVPIVYAFGLALIAIAMVSGMAECAVFCDLINAGI